jgi:hypothetical protein
VGNSFACLSKPGKAYIQCMRGFNGWHLQTRLSMGLNDYTHRRACCPGVSKKSFELKKHDFVSPGQFCDLLIIEDVIAAFRAFHMGKIMPSLIWRPIDV